MLKEMGKMLTQKFNVNSGRYYLSTYLSDDTGHVHLQWYGNDGRDEVMRDHYFGFSNPNALFEAFKLTCEIAKQLQDIVDSERLDRIYGPSAAEYDSLVTV